MNIKKFTVSNDGAIYEAWPDLLQTESGKLICVFAECEHHGNRENARIVLKTSVDKGRTWSEKIPLTEKGTAESYFNNAQISRLNDGSLVIICDKVYKHENSQADIFMWRGDSEGEKWSEPVQLPCHGIVPDKVTQLKNGRIIVASHFYNNDTKKLEQYMWYSDDDMNTWSGRITVAADPRYNLCEASMLECADGTLVCFMRENSFMGYDCMKAISTDGGETWGEVHNLALPGCHRPKAGFLKDGRIFLTYRFMHAGWFPQNTFMAVFDERTAKETEKQKQHTRIIPLDYDANVQPDGGYTGWTQFEDGELYVVNYIKDDEEKAYIRGYAINPEEFVR